MFTSREQLCQEIVNGNLRLNKYDYKFLSNLLVLIIKNNYVTTNQNLLFEKLMHKYKKQLKKHNINFTPNLPWHVETITSSAHFTEAHLKLDNDRLFLRLPFNKKFINDLHEYYERYYHKQIFTLNWDKDNKQYVCEYSIENFKMIYELVTKYYTLNLCNQLSNLLDTINQYKSRLYNPTYVKLNNNYYILCCNQQTYEATSHLTFDNSAGTIYQLTTYGVTIDNSVTMDDGFLSFAGSVYCSFDIDKLDTLVDYLCRLGLTTICYPNRYAYKNELLAYKDKLNILHNSSFLVLHENKVPFVFFSHRSEYKDHVQAPSLVKHIVLENSRPIKL